MNESIKYYNITLSVSELLNQINNNEIILNKNEYRNRIWDNKMSSLFIDSVLRDFPTPQIFMCQDDDGLLTILDGVQRIRSIYSFYQDDIKLTGVNREFNGSRFSSLDSRWMENFLRGRINLTIIDYSWNSPEVVDEILYRLNLGGVNYTKQEFRNRLCSGIMLDSIDELTTDAIWTSLYQKQKNIRLQDEELILRFFTGVSQKNKKSKFAIEMDKFINDNKNNRNLSDNCTNLFLEVINQVYEEIGIGALMLKGKFSSHLFEMLIIPMGLMIAENPNWMISRDEYKAIKKIVKSKEISSSGKRISEGYRIIREGYNGF